MTSEQFLNQLLRLAESLKIARKQKSPFLPILEDTYRLMNKGFLIMIELENTIMQNANTHYENKFLKSRLLEIENELVMYKGVEKAILSDQIDEVTIRVRDYLKKRIDGR